MIEYGRIIGPNGQSYVAQGATVRGRHVAGYPKGSALQDWHGRTLMDCRFDVLEEWRSPDDFGDARYVVAWRLTNGRAIVGLSMGDGMLFRGELVYGIENDSDLRQAAIAEADYWQQVDWEEHQIEQEELCEA